MRDKDGFLIKCKYTDWQIIDERDNKDFVCLNSCMSLNHLCHADERCKYYEPDIKGDLRETIVDSGYIYHPPGKKGVKE